MSWAYSSLAEVPPDDSNPPGWPPDWPDPGDPDDPTDPPPDSWPPGWPPGEDDPVNPGDPTSPPVSSFDMLVACTDIKFNTASTVVAYGTESGGEAPELLGHRVKVTADVQISTDGVTFYDALYFSVTNYTGSKYGISEAIYFDLDISKSGGSITVLCSVVTVESGTINDTDTPDVEELIVSVDALGTIEAEASTAVTVTANVQDEDSLDLDISDGETIRVSAGIDDVLVQVSEDGITFADYVDLDVTNYTGSKYGFSQALYFDVDDTNDGDTLDVLCEIVGFTNIYGVGSGTLEAGDMAYARAAAASITKSGNQTVDGVACVAGDRVFDTGLGIYEVAAGAWTQLKSLAQLATQPVVIAEGTANGKQMYVISKAGTASKAGAVYL